MLVAAIGGDDDFLTTQTTFVPHGRTIGAGGRGLLAGKFLTIQTEVFEFSTIDRVPGRKSTSPR
jgi:hypothetical protein